MAKHAGPGRRRRVGSGALIVGAVTVVTAAVVATVVMAKVTGPGTSPRALVDPDAEALAPVGGLGLSVGEDNRHFVDEAGAPCFWLGDTAWSMPLNLTREEARTYLNKRAALGFNVVQTVAVFNQAGGPGPNRYGDSPYQGDLANFIVTPGADPDDPEQYDYWNHLDFIIREASIRGMRVALMPVWGSHSVGTTLAGLRPIPTGMLLVSLGASVRTG